MLAERSTRFFRISVALAACAAAVWASACRPATGGDAEFWTPAQRAQSGGGSSDPAGGGGSGGDGSGGSGAASGSGASQAASSSSSGALPAGASKLGVAVTTVTFKGKYGPRNVGAVWVTNGQDMFVKTLEVWAVKRIKYLVKWKGVSGGNVVDAITGATRSSHGTHTLAWDMTDVGGKVVPDGVYRVYVEFTEQDAAGKWTSIEFVKGPTSVDSSPPDLPNFTNQHLTFTP